MSAEELSSRLGKSAAAVGGLVLLGPVAIASALVVAPFLWDGNRQLKNLAKSVKCIDSIELSDAFEMFVTATEFIPVMTGLGSVVPRPGFLRSDLRAAVLDTTAAREKGLFRGERAVLEIDYFDRGIRKRDFTERFIDWADHDAMTKAEFRAEARSYERLAAFPELELFAPRYFGRADPLELLSEFAEAPSRYVAGCGIVLEQIPGAASKLAHLEPSLQLRVETLLERFRDEVGIRYVWDGSCFVPGTRAEFTVIDFGTWDGFGDYQIELNETGRLSQTLRARLERENAD